MYSSFEQIPDSVIDAARIDGANKLRIFLHIGIPMASQGIMAAMILGFLEYWNMVEQPVVFIKDKSLWMLSIYLPDLTSENAGTAFSFSLMSIIPALFVFIIGKDVLVKGLSLQGGFER
jgi:multiple sugar transport system permease protein